MKQLIDKYGLWQMVMAFVLLFGSLIVLYKLDGIILAIKA